MKVVWIVLIVLLALGMTYGLMDWLLNTPPQTMASSAGDKVLFEEIHPVEAAGPKIDPIENTAALTVAEKPDPGEEPTRPVQPIEDRDDAMLFEIDALQSMPFDDAITRPFD